MIAKYVQLQTTNITLTGMQWKNPEYNIWIYALGNINVSYEISSDLEISKSKVRD